MLGKSSASRSLAVALGVSFLLPMAALAGNITFLDLTDTLTFTDDTGRAAVSCPGVPVNANPENCSFSLSAPAGSVGLPTLHVTSLFWTELGTTDLSDSFLIPTVTALSVDSRFFSFGEGSTGTCPPIVACLPENGQIQTAFTVTWLNVAGAPIVTDNIQFQSDIADVPEPGSAALIMTGLGIFGISRCRRWKR